MDACGRAIFAVSPFGALIWKDREPSSGGEIFREKSIDERAVVNRRTNKQEIRIIGSSDYRASGSGGSGVVAEFAKHGEALRATGVWNVPV